MSTSSLQNNLAVTLTQPLVLVVATLVIIGAIVFTAYQRFVPPKFAPIDTAQPMFEAEFEEPLDTRDILSLNLFGAPQSAPTAPEKSPEDIPQTNLRLALKGAFAHSVAEKASALIAPDQNSKAELFFIDQQLPGGAILAEVHADFVVLRRNGQREKLQFLRSQPNQNNRYNDAAYQQYTPPAPVQNRYVAPKPDYRPAAPYNPAPYNSAAPQNTNNGSGNQSAGPGSLADIQKILLEKRQKLRQQQQQKQ